MQNLDSFNNLTNPWKNAAGATWDDLSLYAKYWNMFASSKGTDRTSPTGDQKAAWEVGKATKPQPLFAISVAYNKPAAQPGIYAQGLNATSPSNPTDLDGAQLIVG